MIIRMVKYIINRILFYIVVIIGAVIVGYGSYLIVKYGLTDVLQNLIKNLGKI
ncbi:hypothetical protein [Clostridium beijerinckii]|uniref:hypothetical protein n=1 Tax=Clostridium beijerinckii TaxID=1520 RepID=UPI0009D28AA7|nr:hypothetical protein [Clostridium beijerinckii]NRT76279.1 hypothetical protein [Clostridium beijerinckii]OOM38503.1 hypothetical protein CBEIJ_48390 [Clostridium beijerinckii]